MDRSLDSIGSCSLDVDADSSDISDTSGSLNFPTPISVKDITREFTANIRERCTLRSPQQPQPQRTVTTSTYVSLDTRTGGVHMVLTPPTVVEVNESNSNSNADHDSCLATDSVEKKPSYLNLACCVNGYSNLTTYDSKIRQDINKSREVSPIRPSTSSLQYCKRNNSLAAPVLHSMPLTKQPMTAAASKYSSLTNEANNNNNNGHLENGDHLYYNGGVADKSNGPASTGSFIQQRVERLYGPGALAQGFYSPKKHSASLSPVPKQKKQHQDQQELSVTSPTTELSRKFKQLSPSKDYGKFCQKLHNNCTQTASARLQSEQTTSTHNGDIYLPVFRHLSHEFRAQLPTVSPKRHVPRVSPAPEVLLPPVNGSQVQPPSDVVDHESIKVAQLRAEEFIGCAKVVAEILTQNGSSGTTSDPAHVDATVMPAECTTATTIVVKDGNYFLKILKDEQVRLLALAAVAEKYIDALTNNPDITEDTFGLLRSASGKARLLVSQKMKQFEGLCHNNLNRSPEDAFPTTIDDLQGFWDMVYLQVSHVDSIFADIERLKSNDWHRVVVTPKADAGPVKLTKTTKTKAKTGNPGAAGSAGASNSKPAASNSVAAMKREAQRKQLLEMKRQRREAMAAAAKAACDAGDAGSDPNGEGQGQVQVQEAIGDTVNIAVNNSS